MIAYELETPTPIEREKVVRDLATQTDRPLLVLDTCQRLECFGLAEPQHDLASIKNRWDDVTAFERLVRIAAGLESRILGELEVLGQVRQAYKNFHQKGHGSKSLDRLFQEALALARKARRKSGIDANLTSLSGLAAREILNSVEPGVPLVVVGAGSLASSTARYLGKRGKSPVRIASRCPENALELANEVGGFGTGLDELTPLFKDVAGIITATAAPHPVIYTHHLEQAAPAVTIIDLGVPADCQEEVMRLDTVRYIGLEEVERRAEVNTSDRAQRAQLAAQIIKDGAIAWARQR